MEAVKVAIIDDHKLFRDGLAALIRSFSGYEVTLEADNGGDFIDQIPAAGLPDIALLDINMKGMDGFETALWLRQNHPDIKVMALSMYENENSVIRMLKLGARGYVLKDIRKRELEQALASLVEKGYYYTEMVTGKLIHVLTKNEEPARASSGLAVATLSDREIEFLKLAATELSYKEIANEMHLSVHTVDGYRDALFAKLNVRSRVGLVLFAIKNKIVFVE